MSVSLFTSVDDINREIFLNIVDYSDLISTFKTNKYASEIYNDDEFWNQRIQRIYGVDFSKYKINSNSGTYKRLHDRFLNSNGDLIKVVCKLVSSAAKRGQVDVMKYLLEDSGLISQGDEYLKCCDIALTSAARNGQLNTIKYFTISFGAELCTAAFMGHLDIVEYLITHRTYTMDDKNRALKTAAGSMRLITADVVKYLIEVAGADDYTEALMEAIVTYRAKTVEYLVEVVGVRTHDNGAGLARYMGYSDLAQYLENIED